VTFRLGKAKVSVAEECVPYLILSGPQWLLEMWSAKPRDSVRTFGAMLDMLQAFAAKRGKGKEDEDEEMDGSGLSSSQASLSTSGAQSLTTSDFGHHSSFPEEALANAVLVANATMRDEAFVILEDLGIVRFAFRLGNLAQYDGDPAVRDLASALQVDEGTRFCIDFNYATGSGMPLVSGSMLKQSARTTHDVQVCEWLCGVARHVQALYASDREQLRHYGHDSTKLQAQSPVDAGVISALSRFVTKRRKGDSAVGKDMIKALMEEECKFISPGGLYWSVLKDSGASSETDPRREMIESAVGMGFDLLTTMHVSHTYKPKTLELLVQALIGDEEKGRGISDKERQLFAELQQDGTPAMDAAEILVRDKFNTGAAKKRREEQMARNRVESPDIASNFFLSFVEFFSARLREYKRFCIACHAPHNCSNNRAVVCPAALCVFRWENFRLQELFPTSTLCVFERCGSTNWAAQCVQYFGESVDVLSDKYGITQQLVLEMAFHKYLPREEMLKFLTVIKSLNAKSVSNCCSPALCVRFERKLKELEEAGRKGDELKPSVAYHGTAEKNIDLIVEGGFRLDKLAANTGNRGFFGAGIYCSPQASYCIGYCRGGKTILVCAVSMGRRFCVKNPVVGAPLEKGFDSHTDPSGQAEWVLFDEAQILPCFKIVMP
jgi:hypothetical protein